VDARTLASGCGFEADKARLAEDARPLELAIVGKISQGAGGTRARGKTAPAENERLRFLRSISKAHSEPAAGTRGGRINLSGIKRARSLGDISAADLIFSSAAAADRSAGN